MPFLELDVLNNTPEPILGIDLGTTNSMVAVFRGGRPEVLRLEGSDDGRIPSAVYFAEDGQPIIGKRARVLAVASPERCLFSIKRFMGRGLSDAGTDTSDLPFPISETENGLIHIRAADREWTPQEISALILRAVRHIAGLALNSAPPSRAVITVPAYFDDAQRQATRDAARLADLEVLRIINEPTAASLAYGLNQRAEGTIVVYDLGGGTFDVSILTIEEGVFRVLATAGDTHLGGDDLDRAIVEAMLIEMGDEVSEEVRADSAFRQGLRLAAERCKIELSRTPEAEFAAVSPEHGLNWRYRLTRGHFEELIAPFLERTFNACRRAMADAGLATDAIDEVVLVGGSTRVPAVRARVASFFGRKPHTELNPDEVVALGAAVQGHVLAGGTRDILLLDVTPLSLGIETMGGAVSKIIDRNAPIPTQATEGFTTYTENQTGIDFHVVQGERELAADCRSLGRFKLTGIPPMPAGLPRVAVRFGLDADGILTVTAKEESTGEAASIEVQPMHGLGDEKVEEMLEESFTHAREDFDRSRLANLKVELGTMLKGVNANIDAIADRLDPESLADLREAMAAAELAKDEGEEVDPVQKVRDAFEQATLPMAALLMDAVAKQALAGKTLDQV